jgi:cytochrome c biogenesis protein CcmG/thiol:disulfide interchange protein DsbE
MKYTSLFSLLIAFSFNSFAVEVNDKAPEFKLDAIKNASQKVALSQWQGKVVYVDFWASWCGPCKRSFPKLEALRAKYKDKGFEVIAINMDENLEDANGFLSQFSVSFPIVRDASGAVAEQYKVKGMPSGYVIDQSGRVNYIAEGFDAEDEKAIEDIVSALIGS